MAAAAKLQATYSYRIENGLEQDSGLSKAMVLATSRIAVAYETFQYKLGLDEAFLREDWAALSHSVVEFDTNRPTVAGSTVYSFDDIMETDGGPMVHLNVFPMSPTRTAAVFSYLSVDGRIVRRHLRPFISANKARAAHSLSRLLLDSCGNLVFAPSFVDGWTPEKRDYIADYIVRTSWESCLGEKSNHFELFALSG